MSALKPPPQELLGKYDVVHLRLFIGVIQNDDPGNIDIIENLVKMLSLSLLHQTNGSQ